MQTGFDWDGFKKKEFAVLCEVNKEQFFDDCKRHGIYCFLSEFAKKRNLFVCCHLYDDRFSNGRYELAALKGWETKPDRLYGKDGLQEVKTMRLIDADELRDTIENEHFDEYEDKETTFYCIDTAPTVDAVPVVRCKDYKYHDEGENYIYCWALKMKCPNDSEFFCKYGELEG